MNIRILFSIMLTTTLFANGCFSWMGDVRKYEEIPKQDDSQSGVTSQKERKLVGCSATPPTMDLAIAGGLFGIGGFLIADRVGGDSADKELGGLGEAIVRGSGLILILTGLVPLASGITGLSNYSKCKDEYSAVCNTSVTPLVFPPPAGSENSGPGIGLGMTYRF